MPRGLRQAQIHQAEKAEKIDPREYDVRHAWRENCMRAGTENNWNYR